MARKLEITASITDEGRKWTLTVTSTNAEARNRMLWKLKEVAAELKAKIIDGNSPFDTATAPENKIRPTGHDPACCWIETGVCWCGYLQESELPLLKTATNGG